MKRYPSYNPPEYLRWSLHPPLLDGFPRRTELDPERAGLIRAPSEEQQLARYAGLVRDRLQAVEMEVTAEVGRAAEEAGVYTEVAR